MTTQERIQHLTQSGQAPDLLGNFDSADLTSWLEAELGHAQALDQFTPHGPLISKAFAPKTLLHIVSGNTPHAAVQSLLRGILLGSHNIVKLPSSGLPELTQWISQFPDAIQTLIETHTQLTDDHWQRANAVIAIGSDASISAIQQKIRPDQRFIPHGHKISIGIVSCAPDDFAEAASQAAIDASLHNQQGCLSPHAIYIKETTDGDAIQFAGKLAQAMASFAADNPAEPLNLSEAGAVRNLRETTRFSAANSSNHQLWESSDSIEWTVIYDASPELKLSCHNRCIYVKLLPSELNLETLGSEAQHLSSIGIYPFDPIYAESLSTLPAHRICPLGQSQHPSLFWHHDGFAPLSSLVNWKDIG
jgi:hypothetical protein